MKLLTFKKNNDTKLGVSHEKGIIDVNEASQKLGHGTQFDLFTVISDEQSYKELKKVVSEAIHQADNTFYVDETDMHYGPCVPHNIEKIICVGLNYRKHAEETNAAIPEYPILFNKFGNTIAAHNQEIILPKVSNEVDYEAELVIVMGKKAKDVEIDNALDYVFGYCNVNDLSARDLQMRTAQWLLGKTCDDFSPLGPYLVTSDEIEDPNNLAIKTYVNGELKQNSHTSDMIFNCKEIVSYISKHFTLKPGDIILTGTPEGVVLGLPENERVWIQENDVVEVEIEGLGKLRNIFQTN